MADSKRFKVALSFPGEKREYIKEVAEHLSFALGQDKVFYDDYYIDELAIKELDNYLIRLYKNDSDLIVYFLCEEYTKKNWCRLEWQIIRTVLLTNAEADLMQFRFDNFPVEEALAIHGYIEIKNKTTKEISELILKRVRKNEKALAIRQNTEYDAAKEKVKDLEKEIAELKGGKHSPEITKQIEILTREKETLNQQLLQKDEFIAKQENTRQELEESLSAEQGKVELKKQALEAVEEKNYIKAKELLKEAAYERMQKVADDFYQLGKVSELNLEYADALKYYELAAKIPPHNTDYLIKAAELCRTFGMLEPSIKYMEQALLIDLEQYGEESEAVATDNNNLALLWKDKGDFDKAIEYLGKALNTDLKIFGEENPRTAIDYNNIGLALQAQGNLDQAIEYLEKALNIDLKLYSEENLNVAIRYNNIGGAWQAKGDPDKAITYYEKAMNINQKLFGKEYPYVAGSYNNIGMAWQAKGNPDKAIEYIEEALKIDLKLFGEENPNTARDYNNLGLAWHDKGDIKKAIEYGQKSCTILLKLYGADNPTTKTVKENLDYYLSMKK